MKVRKGSIASFIAKMGVVLFLGGLAIVLAGVYGPAGLPFFYWQLSLGLMVIGALGTIVALAFLPLQSSLLPIEFDTSHHHEEQ